MKWTTEKIELFWRMKDEGCSLSEIAEALGVTYQAAYKVSKRADAAKAAREEVDEMKNENAVEEITTETNAESELSLEHDDAPKVRAPEQKPSPCVESCERLGRLFGEALDAAAALGIVVDKIWVDSDSADLSGSKDGFEFSLAINRAVSGQ